MFIQLPIFVGLYRSLMVDVELRDAPLISEAVRWCSNLAAPDMLFNWSWLWNAVMLPSVNGGVGFFGLGPYFNILPIFTIVLFIMQQKMFMPPPTDEQSRHAAEGHEVHDDLHGPACSTRWPAACAFTSSRRACGALAERKLLPKTAAAAKQEPTPRMNRSGAAEFSVGPGLPGNGRNGDADRKRKDEIAAGTGDRIGTGSESQELVRIAPPSSPPAAAGRLGTAPPRF